MRILFYFQSDSLWLAEFISDHHFLAAENKKKKSRSNLSYDNSDDWGNKQICQIHKIIKKEFSSSTAKQKDEVENKRRKDFFVLADLLAVHELYGKFTE